MSRRQTPRPKHGAGFGLDRSGSGGKSDGGDPREPQASNHDSSKGASEAPLIRTDAGAVTSEGFSNALERAVSTPMGHGGRDQVSWGVIPGLSNVIRGRADGAPGTTPSATERRGARDGVGEASIDVRSARLILGDMVSGNPASHDELHPSEGAWMRREPGSPVPALSRPGEFRSPLPSASPRSDDPRIESGPSRELIAAGFPTHPASTDTGGSRPPFVGMDGRTPRGDSSLSALFRGAPLGPPPPSVSMMDLGQAAGSQTAMAPSGLDRFVSGSLSLDGSTGLGGVSPFLGEGDLHSAGSSTIDPAIAGLAFLGQDGFVQSPDALRERGQGSIPLGAAGSTPFGQFGSVSDAADRGSSFDLSKTNDLLQQLLDEVRKGHQPFLPMNDRNSNF